MTLPQNTLVLPTTDITDIGNPPGTGGPLRAGGQAPGSAMQAGSALRDLPSTLSPAAKAQCDALTLIRDVWDGNAKLLEKSQTYLPQGPGEGNADYSVRKRRAALFNVLSNTIRGLAGFVFRTDPQLGDDVPADIVAFWENIDNAGTHGAIFSRDIATDAMLAGHAAIHVEYPRASGTQTAAAEGPNGLRPYWIPIRKENILSWRTTVESGRVLLTQVVLRETTYVPDGLFGEVEQTLYRVLFREAGVVGWKLFGIDDRSKAVIFVDGGLYPTQDEIPIAEIPTSGKRGLFVSDPPFIDLAYLNLAHFREWSDYDTSIHKTCVPLLFTAGFIQQDASGRPIEISANAGINSPDPNGKCEYVSHSGQALTACKQSLDDLENRMGALGLAAMASSKRAAETAKAKEIDKGATDSALTVMARGIQDGLERALYFTARYLGLSGEDAGGSVEINDDFENMVMDPATMIAWGQLAQALNLPARLVLAALIEGGRLPEDTDVDALELEIASATKAAQDQKNLELKAASDLASARRIPPVPLNVKDAPVSDAKPITGSGGGAANAATDGV